MKIAATRGALMEAALINITHYAECALEQFTNGRGYLDISGFHLLIKASREALAADKWAGTSADTKIAAMVRMRSKEHEQGLGFITAHEIKLAEEQSDSSSNDASDK